ncbi:CBS domain-containing protein [Candidatus Saccharibacteria bacterium]|nr:CBS domain-containing protein [Candidatus Saccharibacteria bacterium]
MFTFLVVMTVIVFLSLVVVSGVRPAQTRLSVFELERRSKSGDKSAQIDLQREQLLPDVMSLQRVLTALLLVLTVLLSVTAFGWLIGTAVALVVALEYGAIARVPIIQHKSQKLYEHIEHHALELIKRFPFIVSILRNVPSEAHGIHRGIDSREELQHLVDQSGSILSPDEKKLIVHSLSFSQQLVSSVMTPRSVIDSIKKSEFLGPLTLDELHKTGHSRLPVIDGDIDHVIGTLHLQSLLTLDIKRSVTAEKAMEARVFYIRQDQTLQHSLAAFLRTHHHLFIVVNEFRETVGLLTLEDVIEALLGRKIIDEFDAHDDLRAVALRNPRGNNHPEKREDV